MFSPSFSSHDIVRASVCFLVMLLLCLVAVWLWVQLLSSLRDWFTSSPTVPPRRPVAHRRRASKQYGGDDDEILPFVVDLSPAMNKNNRAYGATTTTIHPPALVSLEHDPCIHHAR